MQQDYKTEMRAMTEGLAEWCHRRERRQRATRALIGAAAVVTVVALLVPQDSGIAVDGNLQCCVDDACDRIDLILAMI
jgi:hypothetical protein